MIFHRKDAKVAKKKSLGVKTVTKPVSSDGYVVRVAKAPNILSRAMGFT